MQSNLKLIDQGYSKQQIIYSQATTSKRDDWWYRIKGFVREFLYLVLRFFGLPTPPSGLPQPNSKMPNINLVSSFEGKIEKILFAFPYRYFNNPYDKHAAKIQQEAQKVFSKVLQKLDIELNNLYIITDKDGKAAIKKWLYDEKLFNLDQIDDIQFLITDIKNFTVWIQDPIAVGKDLDTDSYFIKTPSNFERDNDDQIGLYSIAAGSTIFKTRFLPTNNPSIPSALYFEGGNMLIGDDFWLLGINDLVQGAINLNRPYSTPQDIEAMKELYNRSFDARELILVEGKFPEEIPSGNEAITFQRKNSKGEPVTWYEDFYRGNNAYGKDYQPIFHIDMFISLVGRKTPQSQFTILVGSPKMAFDILTKCYPGIGNADLIAVIASNKSLKKNINYAEIKQAFTNILDTNETMDKVIQASTSMLTSFKVSDTVINEIAENLNHYQELQSNMNLIYKDKFQYAQNDLFDKVAESFDKSKFNVIRNPLPFIYEDNTVDKIREWYYATSNNVLVQNTESHKQVFLPTYGHGEWEILKWTDKANHDIWSSLGYNEITMLPNFQGFAYQLGALHCIIKTLERN